MRGPTFWLIGALALLLGALVLKGQWLTLPELPAPGGDDRFEANRAVARLQRVLGDERPHPVDSDAGDAVRERLLAEMRRVGLEPRITDDFECNGFLRSRTVACARVRNLVGSIGPSTGPHLLLSAHYDSTFAGPGAGDDGFGMATLLEVASLLRGRALRRPVTFLFNEGEEMGLIGARAFLDHDPLARRVDTALNFEARGVEGPAIMFETSRPNGRAIALFARAADRPVANSLSTDLYRLIPNSTDVTVYQERGWAILNFAIIGNETRYHSAGDNLAALDRRSLQHMGDQALALALKLATASPADAPGDRIYADLLSRQLVVLPVLFGLILLGLLLLFFLLEGWRRRALGRPLAVPVFALGGSAALAWTGHTVIGLLRDGDYWRGHPDVAHLAIYASAMTACLMALLLVPKDAGRTRLRIGFWLAFLLAGAAIALVAPGGMIYFLVPPLAMAAGLAVARRRPGAERVGAIAGALLLYLTFGPSLALFEELMSSGPPWIFAPLASAILLPILVELRPLIGRVPRPHLFVTAAVLCFVPWIVVAATPAYSEDRRQLFTIEYVWDADARQGRWAVNNDGAPIPYDAAWRRAGLPYSRRKRWVAPAPAIEVPTPVVEVVARQPLDGGRRIRLRLRTNGAESVALIAPATALRGAGEGRSLRAFAAGADDKRSTVRCIGRACDGALVDLVIGHAGPVPIILVGTRTGLPAAAAPLVQARPVTARPQYSPDSTLTIARIRL